MADAHLTLSGFADLCGTARPRPPEILVALLCTEARTLRPRVVDLGSGTGPRHAGRRR